MDKNKLYIIIASMFFFMPFLGAVHLFDWDEINFAEIAREMVISGDYLRPQINFQIFTEKPPMFMWLQAASMNIFGMNEYAARFPNTIAGIITLLFLYHAGTKLYNKKFGLLWAGAYFGSILPHLYFRSGIIDPWFNLFIFLGIYHLILTYWKKENFANYHYNYNRWMYLILAGIFTGLAILVKGPVAYLIISITLGVYWILNKFKFYLNIIDFIVFTLFTVLTASIWFGVVTLFYGSQFAIEFTIRQWELFSQQDAGHGGFLGYHFVVLFLGVFPASIFVIRSFWGVTPGFPNQTDLRKWMLILFWVILILFSIVSTKIIHYSSMAYFPMAFLAAMVINQIKLEAIKLSLWMKVLLLFIPILIGSLVIALPSVGMNIEILHPLLKSDPFAQGNLSADVPWTGFESIPGIWLIVSSIIGVIYLNKGRIFRGAGWLFGGTALFVFLTLSLVITKIEAITQNAAIEFYASKADCNCYVVPEGYKSYAQLFYAEVAPDLNPNRYDNNWLKTGDIDKDVFFVAKVNHIQNFEPYKDIVFLYEKNGFTFWQRKATK